MRKVHKSKGLNYGVGICTYFSYLMALNEVSTKKMTDEDIAHELQREFPNKPILSTFLGPGKRRTINEYRHRYNSGFFNGGVGPRVLSRRYNKEGEVINGRTGR